MIIAEGELLLLVFIQFTVGPNFFLLQGLLQ